MNWSLLGGIALVAVAALALKAMLGRGRKPPRIGYQKRDFLFAPEERLFLAALRQAVGEDYEVFGKIRADAILTPRPTGRGNPREDSGDPLAGYHFDFVLCRKEDLAIACAVRLQDHFPTGRNKPQEPADILKQACQAAGLPLVGFATQPMYDAHEIAEAIAQTVRQEPVYLTESGGRKEPRISRLDNLEL